MSSPVRQRQLALLLLALACGGEGPAGPGQSPPPPLPGSLVILTGEGQTDTAGATFATPVTVEVRDTNAVPLRDVPVWFGETLTTGDFFDYLHDSTDATGRVEYVWRPGGQAGAHRLRAVVYVADAAGTSHLIAADTIIGTVLPASPAYVDLNGPASRLLGEPLDLATVVGPARDAYGNPVAVTSVAAEAPAPFQVNGTVVHSDVEADEAVTILVNGVPFLYRLLARRDLRELTGAHGSWVCDSDPGLLVGTPELYLHRREGEVTVDSVVVWSDDGWIFYLSGIARNHFSDGTSMEEPLLYPRPAGAQAPGVWYWGGTEMVQTGTDPLRYEASWVDDCGGWLEAPGTTPAHQPFSLTR